MWWTCAVAFVIGMVFGWHKIRSSAEPLPVPKSLASFDRVDLRLTHPFPEVAENANAPRNLRVWLYSGHELAGPPLATSVQRPVFDKYTPWLKSFVEEKLNNDSSNFSLKMRGWITFPSARAVMYIRSEKGYRVHFRNASGEEQTVGHWTDDWTDDAVFGANVEPGRYEIEIDYFNTGDGGYFEFSTTPNAALVAAPDSTTP